jgi:hypothetical protein
VDRDWTLLAFVLLLVHGDAIHAFASGQRRAHPQAEHERTTQASSPMIATRLIRRELKGQVSHLAPHPPDQPVLTTTRYRIAIGTHVRL